jgi:hypothetical protein
MNLDCQWRSLSDDDSKRPPRTQSHWGYLPDARHKSIRKTQKLSQKQLFALQTNHDGEIRGHALLLCMLQAVRGGDCCWENSNFAKHAMACVKINV